MLIMTLKQCPMLGAIMTPKAAAGGVMLTLTCVTADLSRRHSTVEKYKPCFIRASVRPGKQGGEELAR